MLGFGMCGCGGYIERAALPMIEVIPEAQAVAAYDVSADRVNLCADKFEIPNRCFTFEDLLRIKEVDIVYVATPNALHKPQTIAAAEAGKHVFSQKPLGLNVQECREMIASCKANGVKLGVGFCNRFHGAQQKAVNMVREGVLGDVTYMHSSFNLFGYTVETANWRCDPKLAGGGPLMDLSPHIVDWAAYVFDDVPVSAMAYVRPKPTDTQVEMDVAAIVEFKKGARLAIDTSFNTRLDVPTYQIVGSKGKLSGAGTMVWLTGGEQIGELTWAPGWDPVQKLEFSGQEHIGIEMSLFCQAIMNNTQPPVPGEAGLIAQAAIDAIYESGRTSKRVEITI